MKRFIFSLVVLIPSLLLSDSSLVSRGAKLITECALYNKITHRESISFRYLRSHAPIDGVIDPWSFLEMHSRKSYIKLPTFAELSEASHVLYTDEDMQTFERSLQTLGEEVIALGDSPEMSVVREFYAKVSQFRFDFKSLQDLQVNFRILNEIENFVENGFDKGVCYFEKDNLHALRSKLRNIIPSKVLRDREGKCELSDRAIYLAMVAGKETRNTFGYHATTNAHAVFQEVVRAVVEHVIQTQLPEDFYFLRIPGLRQYDGMNAASFLRGRTHVHDLRGKDQDLLVSLNPCLFSNHGEETESTMSRLFLDESVGKGDMIAASLLCNFMEMAGFSKEDGEDLAKISGSLPSENGTLLQLELRGPKKELNKYAYASRRHGVPEEGRSVERVLAYPRQEDQFRCVMSNEGTLNPFGPIKIRSYRAVDPKKLVEMRAQLARRIAQAQPNVAKVKAYRKKLMKAWGLTPFDELN